MAKILLIWFGIATTLVLYLYIYYRVNYIVAQKMNWWELGLCAIGCISGLFPVLFVVWMINSLRAAAAWPFEIDE